MAQEPTLVVGDVHGHFNRLEALLEQEGIIRDGKRVNSDVRVVQVGDLGHFGHDAPPEDDYKCWAHAKEFFDKVVWGNHDRAVFDSWHQFAGYKEPFEETKSLISSLSQEGFVVYACKAHDHLITHGGLHPIYDGTHHMNQASFDSLDDFVEFINHNPHCKITEQISRQRGGPNHTGGILWRDQAEKLSDRWPQVFGHSQIEEPRSYHNGMHYNIDVGGIDNGKLAGIWLPEKRIVQVKVVD